MTCADSLSAISSPASADGATPCGLQDGPMTDLFGQALAPVSHSAQPVRSVAQTMSATYGLRSSGSSASAALQASLASRLPGLLGLHGSTMYALTWKEQVTPLRRRICALLARGHSTSDSGSTGWPTAQSRDGAHSRSGMVERTGGQRRNLDDYVMLAAWPTCKAGDADKGVRSHRGAMNELERKGPGSDLPTMAAAAWATPATPATPATRDWKSNEGSPEFHAARAEQARSKPLSEQAHTLLGATSNGSTAQTAKPGQLNPAFSRWLQGYPKGWCEAAIEVWHRTPTRRARRELCGSRATATRSSRK
jgi:hypothetical protein